MALTALAEVIGRLLLLVGVGLALRLGGVLRRDDVNALNAVILYVGVPALVFQAVQPARLQPDLALMAAVAWGVALLGVALAYASARGLRLKRPAVGALMLAAALGNTGYIGYPVSQALLGQQGLVRAVFYDVFGTVLVLLTVGFAVAGRFGESENPVSYWRELLRFPAVIAVVIALLLHGLTVPKLVSGGLDALASMTVPLIMISVGVSLRPSSLREHAVPVGVAAALKLLVLPLAALALARLLLPGQTEAQRLLVLEAGTPSMMLGLVVGMRFGLESDLIASAILVTTVASALTIPLLQLVVR